METSKISIYDLKPAEYNPRVMPSDEMDKLTTSLRTFGLVDPIIIDLTDNNTIIGGHQRYEALMHLDEEDLTLIPLGDIGLVINETSIRIKDKNDQKALNLALNKIQGEWDYDKRDIILTELNADGYNIELTGFTEDELKLDLDLNIDTLNDYDLNQDENSPLDDKYTHKTSTPIYTPSNEKPAITDCYNSEKRDKLIQRINESQIPPEIKEFLKLASNRHISFNYSLIADFYAHSNKEIQELFEQNALVIIDYERAIQDGYVKIKKTIEEETKNVLYWSNNIYT